VASSRGSTSATRTRRAGSPISCPGIPRWPKTLCKEAFVRVAGRLLHLRDPAGFHAYLRTTIVNLARSHFRRVAVERRFIERQGEPRPVEATDVSDRDTTRRALMELPIRQRTAIVLRYFEDLSEAQVAELMRCRPGAVKSLVSRAMTTLRSSLGEDR
jgi:RNA polymerase sigma factor (sigma-70 family)